MIAEYARLVAFTLQLCGWTPTYEVTLQVYGVLFHVPRPGHYNYVGTAMCEARNRGLLGGATCHRVNNVCLNP